MARALRTISFVGVALVLAAGALFLLVFKTAPGRSVLKSAMERSLAHRFGGEAEIGALKGDLPAEIILENARFADADGRFLEIDAARLQWRPGALIAGRLEARRIEVDGAVIRRLPSIAAGRARPKGFELPEALPHIALETIDIKDFRIAGGPSGAELALEASGRVLMAGPSLDIAFEASSEAARDHVSVRIDRRGEELAAAIDIRSEPDGALSTLLKLGGPLTLGANGAGPMARWRLDFNGRAGAFGAAAGRLDADLGTLDRIGYRADLEAGQKLETVQKFVGDRLVIEGAFIPHESGGELRLARAQSALTTIRGAASWRNRAGALQTLSLNFAGDLKEAWRPDLRRFLGKTASLRGEVARKAQAYAVSGAVTAELAAFELKNAASDLKSFLKGPATLFLAENAAAPKGFQNGLEATGDIDFRLGDRIGASNVKLKTAEGGTFRGATEFRFPSNAITVEGAAAASPELVKLFAPTIDAKRFATAEVRISGAPDDLDGRLLAQTPPLLLGRARLPAASLLVSFVDAPKATSGQVSIRAVDGSRVLRADYAKSDARWTASGLDYKGRGFELQGSLSFDPQTRASEVDLRYRGADGAEPWPLVRIAGAASAKGEIGPAPTSRLSLAIATLAFDGMTLDGLTAFAEGPVHALKMSGALTAIRRDGLSAIENVSAAGTADFGRRRIIRLETFDAEIAGETLRLDKPARFDFADGVAIDGLKASIGQTGVFSFDGAFARPRWRGRLALQEAPLSRAASLIDADIDFDTDRKVPGRGVFRIKTDLADPATSALAGEFSWDGRTLDVADDGKTEGLDIALKLPMRLVRAPALRVDTTGALSGAARYEGRAETVAVFLPAALQSMEGALTFDGSAGGTLARPKLTGALVISKGAYTELASGLSILDIDAQAKAESAGEATRIDFSASGRGPSQTAKTIRADGALTLGPAPRADVRISLAKAKLSAGPIASVSATGEATLAGAFSDLHASGDLSISALQSEIVTPKPTGLVDIDVVRVDGDGASGHERAPPPRSSPVTLNIRLRGDDRLFIRGRGLDSEWRADMKLEGRADAPLVTGVMTLKDGAIEFAGRLFKMTKGEVAFDALSPNNPMLDMRAERETEDGTVAAIVIAGRAKAPKIALESTPARPTEDVMALLLFDKPASDLSAIESLQVADSLVALGGVGPFGGAGLSGSARQALGLDLLNVAVAEEDAGATALTVGKYVSPDLFISATQDARGENGSIRVEYEITDSITIETELHQDGDQTVSANWKRDF